MVGDFNDIALEHIRIYDPISIYCQGRVSYSLNYVEKRMKCAPFLLFLMIKFSPRITEKRLPNFLAY